MGARLSIAVDPVPVAHGREGESRVLHLADVLLNSIFLRMVSNVVVEAWCLTYIAESFRSTHGVVRS